MEETDGKSIIYVMKFWYLFLISASLSCSCLESRSPSSELTFPDTELKEIIIRGNYSPGGQKSLEALKKWLVKEGKLKEGESITEALKDEYKDYIREYFNYSEMLYCYQTTNNKESDLSHDLRARLYDKEGKMLTEDKFRFVYPDVGDFSRIVVAYLTYHNEGHEIRVVRLEKQKEMLIETFEFDSYSVVRDSTRPDTPFLLNEGYTFDKETQCHHGPGPM